MTTRQQRRAAHRLRRRRRLVVREAILRFVMNTWPDRARRGEWDV